jgi:polyisoprenoid-binding protein YceI
MVRFTLCLAVFLAAMAPAMPLQSQNKDTAAGPRQGSVITIHVHKTGLFSGFAHNHTITAPVTKGKVDNQGMAAEIIVLTKDMKVVDPEVSEKDRAEIQTTMLGPKVLDTDKFPQVRFVSTHIEPAGPQHYRVTGKLELHGASRVLTFEVTGGPGRYHGQTKLKQTDFGIQPVSLGGGTVKVKDEIEIEFDIGAADIAQH